MKAALSSLKSLTSSTSLVSLLSFASLPIAVSVSTVALLPETAYTQTLEDSIKNEITSRFIDIQTTSGQYLGFKDKSGNLKYVLGNEIPIDTNVRLLEIYSVISSNEGKVRLDKNAVFRLIYVNDFNYPTFGEILKNERYVLVDPRKIFNVFLKD
jgi:hypothetical protein